MNATDPRPAYRPMRQKNHDRINGAVSEIVVAGHRSERGTSARFSAMVTVAATSGAITVDLPTLTPDTARWLAGALQVAADDCERLDDWHARNTAPEHGT